MEEAIEFGGVLVDFEEAGVVDFLFGGGDAPEDHFVGLTGCRERYLKRAPMRLRSP